MEKTDNKENDKAEMRVALDDLDKKILRVIQDDAKASLRDIADKVNSNVSTVKNHYDRLMEKAVIKRYSAIIDCCKIGYTDMLIFYIRVNTSQPMQEILKQLSELHAINFLYQVSGDFPILGMAKCVNKDAQIDTLEQIKRIKGVEEVTTQVVMRRIKEDIRLEIP
jgi:DNA-binding Lrp family transcriptional regulator